MNLDGKSWKTTTGGIVGILSGLAIIAGTFFTPAGVTLAVLTIPAGVGLIGNGIANLMAKDRDVTGVPNAANSEHRAVTPKKE